jgi:hypothetical protein
VDHHPVTGKLKVSRDAYSLLLLLRKSLASRGGVGSWCRSWGMLASIAYTPAYTWRQDRFRVAHDLISRRSITTRPVSPHLSDAIRGKRQPDI